MKKTSLLIITMVIGAFLHAQNVEKITIPAGIVYNYCEVDVYENAKMVVEKELTSSPEYKLAKSFMFIGPNLWKRYKKVKTLSKIEGGNVTLMNTELTCKMTQTDADSKLVWDQVYKEVNGKEFKLRKANEAELKYYWSVISFDIDEPLIIIETKEHRYILNLSAEDFHLIWLDEAN